MFEMNGTVLSWNRERGFGFIEAASGKRYFAHISGWESDDAPEVGQKVVFELAPADKGPKAVNIRLLPDTTPGLTALANAGAAVAARSGGAE
jgi:CspA family cold shock protein